MRLDFTLQPQTDAGRKNTNQKIPGYDNKFQTAQRNVAVPLVHELDIPQAAQTDRIVNNLGSACLAQLGCKYIRRYLSYAI